jgi:hypothetical protein
MPGSRMIWRAIATVSRTVGRAAGPSLAGLSGQPTLAQVWPVKQRASCGSCQQLPALGDALEAVGASVGEANP